MRRDLPLIAVAARGESPVAVDRRRIRPTGVVHRSHATGMFPLLALCSQPCVDLDATRDIHHGLRALVAVGVLPVPVPGHGVVAL